jgi:hypothetical protein
MLTLGHPTLESPEGQPLLEEIDSHKVQAGDYLNVALVFSGIIAIAIMGLTLDACLRGLLYLADPSKRQ